MHWAFESAGINRLLVSQNAKPDLGRSGHMDFTNDAVGAAVLRNSLVILARCSCLDHD